MKNTRLSNARNDKGYSQSKFASILGCSKSAVSNWETGYANPPLAMALKISKILGKDVEFLFCYEVQDSHTEKEAI